MYTCLFINLMDVIEDIIYRAIKEGIKQELMTEVEDRLLKEPNKDLYMVYSQSYDDIIKSTNQ